MQGSFSPFRFASPSRVARIAASASDLHLGAGIFGARHRPAGELGEDRLEPVMALMMQMVGLGGGEHDAVDARREQARPQAVRPGPEAFEDLGHGALEIGHRRLARHSAPRARRSARSAGRAGRNVRGRTAARRASYRPRSAAPSSRHSEPRAKLAPASASSGAKVSAGEPARSPGIRKRPGGRVDSACSVGARLAQIAGERSASVSAPPLRRRGRSGSTSASAACQAAPALRAPAPRALLERRARPVRDSRCQQRQVEQPFAGIIDDVDIQLFARAARPRWNKTPVGRGAPAVRGRRLRPGGAAWARSCSTSTPAMRCWPTTRHAARASPGRVTEAIEHLRQAIEGFEEFLKMAAGNWDFEPGAREPGFQGYGPRRPAGAEPGRARSMWHSSEASDRAPVAAFSIESAHCLLLRDRASRPDTGSHRRPDRCGTAALSMPSTVTGPGDTGVSTSA